VAQGRGLGTAFAAERDDGYPIAGFVTLIGPYFVRWNMRQRTRRVPRAMSVLLLFVVTPLLMGGCPDFQDEAVSAVETAAQSIITAAVTLFFDQYRSN
jgi:hypothetical protein